MASSLLQSLTVLTEDDNVPGSKFDRDPQEYTVDQLKRWLKCRGLKLSGKRHDLVKRVSDCIKCGNHNTLDASINNGKWFAAKVLKETPQIQAIGSSISLPFIPLTGWQNFPSHCIPSIFNYGHVYYYALKSLANDLADIDDGLGHMTDKPMKNERKYVDSGFLHYVMDTQNGDHYFVRACLAFDENRATAQCCCHYICEQWRCSLRVKEFQCGKLSSSTPTVTTTLIVREKECCWSK